MTKQEMKNILMSIRTPENENVINMVLGKIDMADDQKIQKILEGVGNDEDNVKRIFQDKVEKMLQNSEQEHIPINDMFSYGVDRVCIHLHVAGDLHDVLAQKGVEGLLDTMTLQMLDAIDRIKTLKDNGFYKFQGKEKIYMISPIFGSPAFVKGKALEGLKELGFETKIYNKEQLRNNEFVEANSEAQLATRNFGTDKNVGTATISLEKISSRRMAKNERRKDSRN